MTTGDRYDLNRSTLPRFCRFLGHSDINLKHQGVCDGKRGYIFAANSTAIHALLITAAPRYGDGRQSLAPGAHMHESAVRPIPIRDA
ncbi:hypothetical protein AM587_10008650 [Phytophthora nicotianae]|uniref:Uncharacterized protein n=1 Tax=Phytophthora nicotianae TaxID=4792 RepID=A0A0W8DX73_PHYNI|nr:hypothetical protein AM587_10008650 [Phytophthora nicotianae]